MSRCRLLSCLAIVFVSASTTPLLPTLHAHTKPLRHVLMISIDGMRPDYVAGPRAWKLPTLNRFVTEGAYATGVVNELPAVTYPNHTTLITGVPPDVHGIVNNTTFDPLRLFSGPWFWYGVDIHAQTLFEAVHAAGGTVASVSWPVTVDAPGVDYLIPEFWRIFGHQDDPDDRKLIAGLTRPLGMLQTLEKELGPYYEGHGNALEGDRIRTRFSDAILREKKPAFMTIHLAALDSTEHTYGPFSSEAEAVLQKLDAMVGQLIATERAIDPHSVVVVVSDHGFTHVEHSLNLSAALVSAGLMEVAPKGAGNTLVPTAWTASVWGAEGSAAIVLRDPSDKGTLAKTAAVLSKLAADPANGVDQVLDAADLKRVQAWGDASFAVTFKPGYEVGSQLAGPLLTPANERGAHGYSPELADMHSSFFVMGEGVAHGRNLGEIPMLRVAPTVADLLGVRLKDAREPALSLH